MFYKRKGLPEEDEIVLCKVTKIFPNSVFVDLIEYNQPGMVHISEVSPGRIRNLREFVSIDRQIVCKVLRVDQKQGHIDLSLRRVNSVQRREKLEEIKQELKAERLVKNLAKKLKRPEKELYDELSSKICKEYSHLNLCFQDVVSGDVHLEKLGLEKNVAKELAEAVAQTIQLRYVGAGRYKLVLEDVDYKPAEKNLVKVQKIIETFIDKLSTASFERE